MTNSAIDVHQHLWPETFVEALRLRRQPPYLTDWTLHTVGEAPYAVDAAAHDEAARAARETDRARVLVSLSSPLGIEDLAPDDAAPLLDAWHDGARRFGGPFGAWASVCHVEPDLAGLGKLLAEGFAGLQIPATRMATPAALEEIADVLRVCELAGKPVLVHPGAVARPAAGAAPLPAWWPAMVDYPAQMQAAWWTWHAVGRSLLPDLRVCFAAGAGLAPAHDERYVARAGSVPKVDPGVFVDTSSYGRRGLGALIQALGIDVVVLGSDRPYAEPTDPGLGAAATHAIRIANPRRLLDGGRP